MNRDRLKAYLGIGAFNLVRTTAYRQCGGHEALHLTVLDDMKLGLLLIRICDQDETNCSLTPSLSHRMGEGVRRTGEG